MRIEAVAVALGLLLAGCGENVPPASPVPSSPGSAPANGKGTLLVTGMGKESYGLHDGKGVFLQSVKTNEEKELAAGTYAIHLGNRVEAAVKGGERTTIAAGTLLVTGTGKESYGLHDAKGVFQLSVKTNEEKELAAGTYTIHLGNRVETTVKGGERTTIAAGTLLVTGTGKESYGLHDAKGVFQLSVKTNEEKELAAGAYTVHLGNRVETTVKGGERTTIAAGTLVVAGTGTESYGLYDGKGVFQMSVKTGEEKELAAGTYTVKVGDKDHPVEIVAGKRTNLER